MKKILFITTTNLATNPRLLKELKLAGDNNLEISLMAFKLGNWSDITDSESSKVIKREHCFYLSATRKPFLGWLISNIIWKISSLLNVVFVNSLIINAIIHNKRTIQLVCNLNKISSKYDLVIAHNLGSLYPAYYFSKKHNIPFAFDMEDYHPGEKCSIVEKKRREFLMEKILPNAAYITYASPLIGKNSLELLAGESIPENMLINNCFSLSEFQMKETTSDKIKLVWFSQNIAPGRGLELIIPALAKYKYQIELTLIGNLYPDFYKEFLSEYIDFIKIENPLSQKELNLKLSEFDFGLAIELKTADFNRDICLTNKIFAYAQSGLYILATDTTAQTNFIAEHPQLGIIVGQTIEEMQIEIKHLIENIENIRAEKKSRFEQAKKLAWEIESQKLMSIWNKMF